MLDRNSVSASCPCVRINAGNHSRGVVTKIRRILSITRLCYSMLFCVDGEWKCEWEGRMPARTLGSRLVSPSRQVEEARLQEGSLDEAELLACPRRCHARMTYSLQYSAIMCSSAARHALLSICALRLHCTAAAAVQASNTHTGRRHITS